MTEQQDVESARADAEIETALGDIGRRQPALPPGFAATVMRGVEATERGLSPWRRWRRSRRAANFVRGTGVDTGQSQQRRPAAAAGGDNVGKKIMFGVMGLGAAAVVAMFVMGIPPVGEGTEGTIGAAKRYQGAALADKDVVVGSMDLQQFLQSETFDRIMKNEAARTLLMQASQNTELRAMLAEPALVSAFATVELQQAFSNVAFQQALLDVEFQQALSRLNLKQAFADVALQQALLSADFQRAFATAELKPLLMNANFQAALANAEFRALLLNAEFQQALAQPALMNALKMPGLINALAEPALMNALKMPALMNALAEPAFQQALRIR